MGRKLGLWAGLRNCSCGLITSYTGTHTLHYIQVGWPYDTLSEVGIGGVTTEDETAGWHHQLNGHEFG